MTDKAGRSKQAMMNRLQAQHAFLVDAYRHAVADATVCVLGARNGHWCYAYAAAGALQVVGIEADEALVDSFAGLPDIGLRERIEMRCADPVEELEEERRCGRQYDIIVLMDVLAGRDDLERIFELLKDLSPTLILADGMFSWTKDAVLALQRQKDGLPLLPSFGMLRSLAERIGGEVTWVDWDCLAEDERMGLDDYYANGPTRRASFAIDFG